MNDFTLGWKLFVEYCGKEGSSKNVEENTGLFPLSAGGEDGELE